jgi:hypothetical protein
VELWTYCKTINDPDYIPFVLAAPPEIPDCSDLLAKLHADQFTKAEVGSSFADTINHLHRFNPMCVRFIVVTDGQMSDVSCMNAGSSYQLTEAGYKAILAPFSASLPAGQTQLYMIEFFSLKTIGDPNRNSASYGAAGSGNYIVYALTPTT